MAQRNWTPAQQQCLEATGTVLVSAAAGSGKTAVLVERIVRLITDVHHPVDVDQLLVVTFTKAAAAEMKQRLAAALSRCLAERPDDRRLQRQLMLLPDAAISTVHSFCGNLIRAHFHRFPSLSPQFRVWEERQTAPLRAEAMDEVLEARYAEGDPAFLELVDLLGGKRDDRALAERVETLYNFVQADPQPTRWLQEQTALYDRAGTITDSAVGLEVRHAVTATLDWCRCLCESALTACRQEDGYLLPYESCFAKDKQAIEELLSLARMGSWDELYMCVQRVTFERLPVIRKCEDPAGQAFAKFLRDLVKSKVKALAELMAGDEETLAKRTVAIAPVVKQLFSLVEQYGVRYAEKKQQQGILDFNDLEHYALQLLTETDEHGGLRPSPLAVEVGKEYAHIMVDEYQDTNPTQEWLFRAVSRNEENLFFVGDVKQSIYAFRNATPALFVQRRDRYVAFDGITYPAVIRLGHNFRSRPSVTQTVNFLFDQLMTIDTCGVDYANGEGLVAAGAYSEKDTDVAELLLIERDTLKRGDNVDVAEARVIAARLREMQTTLTVKDGEGERPLRWGDVCILLRSVKDHASLYAEELNRLGIPAVSSSGNGFWETPEIQMAVSLLRFLDNPLWDVALLAVMLSPLFAFTPDDLAAIRENDRHTSLFVSVRRVAKRADALGARCASFLQQTDRWRTRAAAMTVAQLLTLIFEETALPAVMNARVNGAQRTANLYQLLDMARGFEQNGYRGLPAFVRYIVRESEREDDLPPAVTGDGQDAVRVMSIHASKGLEFPVVFLAGVGRGFNMRATSDTLLLHRELGVGIDWLDMQTMQKHRTLQKHALAQRLRRDERAEDLRVLYVALTRAKERLCMVGTCDVTSAATRAAAAIDTPVALPSGAVMEANGYLEWILMGLLRHPDATLLRNRAESQTITPLPCDSRLSVQVLEALPALDTVCAVQDTVPPDEEYLAALDERVSYRYPFEALGAVPVKVAASVLAHQEIKQQFVATARPAFFSDSTLSPAERGTAMHQFMQFAEYTSAATDLEGEIRRLVRSGFLSDVQGKSLARGRLRAFFESDLYRRICASPQVKREYAFAVERPAAECVPGLDAAMAAGETVLVQGIADCVFWEDDHWVIVDYKTDRVTSPDELAVRYRPQLRLYAEALTRGLGEPVGECLLYSFSLQQVVPVS